MNNEEIIPVKCNGCQWTGYEDELLPNGGCPVCESSNVEYTEI